MGVKVRQRHVKSLVIGCIMGGVMGLSALSLEGFWLQTAGKSSDAVREAILRSAVQCYALEGAYPEDLIYLRDHYGIQLNTRAYFYHYEYLGANIRPNVEVVRKWSD